MPEDEPDDQPDILERINNNLKAIHSELEIQNKGAMRSNVRLAVLIVVFAIPASFFVEVLWWFYMNEILIAYTFNPDVLPGDSLNFQGYYLLEIFIGLTGLVFLLFVIVCSVIIFYKYFNPLITLLYDPELEEFIKELNDKKKSEK